MGWWDSVWDAGERNFKNNTAAVFQWLKNNAPKTGVVAAVLAFIDRLPQMLSTLHSNMMSVKGFQGQGAIAMLGKANTIFPVTEILAMLAALFILRVTASVIRAIVALLP